MKEKPGKRSEHSTGKQKMSQVPHEVQVMRTWIEEEIINRGICPPLTKIARHHRDRQGHVKWQEVGDAVDIVTFKNFAAGSSKLLDSVMVDYFGFMAAAVEGTAPVSKVYVLPDFKTNADYDAFVTKMTIAAMVKLQTDEGMRLVSDLMGRVAEMQAESADAFAISEEPVEREFYESDEGQEAIAIKNVIEGLFNPVYFFAQPLSDDDLAGFSEDRGPRARMRVLSRSPYYAIQIVNGIGSKELTGNLTKQKVRQKVEERNTKLALAEEIPIFDRRLRKYRTG